MTTHKWHISSSNTKQEWLDYYDLRWRILRKPWSQEKGTEKDKLEATSIHRIAIQDRQVVGVGRIHLLDQETAQIRYMAVDPDFSGLGVGSAILLSLEDAVKAKNVNTVILHSRESALNFYEQQGYSKVEKTHVLYGDITHYLMNKTFRTQNQ
ncbi:MAG: GNAT family N-acetyltransferase [Thiotrichaceae bacterium]